VSDPVASAAAELVSHVERNEGLRLTLVRIARFDGVCLACYRQADPSAEGLIVLLDEEAPGQWEALGASYTSPGGSKHTSIRPSERGDWIVAVSGSAPAGSRSALVGFGGSEHRVPVEQRFYAFALRLAAEPDSAPAGVRFE
jgi:hypothetical protein